MSRGSRRPGEDTPAPEPSRRWSATGVAEAILWLLVVAVPLVVLPTARQPFALPKLVVGEWLALASLLVLAGGAAAAGRFSLARPWSRSAVRVALPLLAVAFLARVFSDHPIHAGAGLAHLAVALAALVGWSAGLGSRRLGRLLAGLLLPAALLALLGILQFHGLYRLFDFTGGFEAERQGVTSLAGNPGHLGAFLAFGLVVGLALLRRWGDGRADGDAPAAPVRHRLVTGAGMLLVVYGLAVTQTLVALAAAAVGLVAVVLLTLPRRRAAILLAAALVAGLVVVAAVEPLRERVTAKGEELVADGWNVFLSGRLDGWRAAAWMVGEDPWTGVGPGAYVTEFNTAKLDLLERGVPFYRYHVDPTFASAHNELLQVAAEWGWPGVLALLWALWVVGRSAVRVARRGDAGEVALAVGGLGVLAVLALFHFPFRLALTGFPALLWLAWLLRRGDELGGGGAAPDPAEPTGGFPRGAERAVAWSLVVLLAAALFVQTVHGRDRLRASRIVQVVEGATVLLEARGRIPGTVLWGHVRLLREAEVLDPTAVSPLAGQGVQYLLLDRPREAVETYRRALDREPRPELWLGLGRARWAAGEREAAVEDFVRAVRLHPRLGGDVPAAAREAVDRRLAGGA